MQIESLFDQNEELISTFLTINGPSVLFLGFGLQDTKEVTASPLMNCITQNDQDIK